MSSCSTTTLICVKCDKTMDFKRKKLICVFYDIKAYINCYIIIDFSATELHKNLRVNNINSNPGNKINIKPTTSSNLTHVSL